MIMHLKWPSKGLAPSRCSTNWTTYILSTEIVQTFSLFWPTDLDVLYQLAFPSSEVQVLLTLFWLLWDVCSLSCLAPGWQFLAFPGSRALLVTESPRSAVVPICVLNKQPPALGTDYLGGSQLAVRYPRSPMLLCKTLWNHFWILHWNPVLLLFFN